MVTIRRFPALDFGVWPGAMVDDGLWRRGAQAVFVMGGMYFIIEYADTSKSPANFDNSENPAQERSL